MRKCISRIISKIIHLWQTFLNRYVCRRDIDDDGHKEIIIDLDGSSCQIPSEQQLSINEEQIDNKNK